MPPGFVRWYRAAAKYDLTGAQKDPLGAGRYPTPDSTEQLFPNVVDKLTELIETSSWVLLHGLPSTGKTFHALAVAKHYQKGEAFYAPVDEIDIEELGELWDSDDAALWIVDDVQKDPEHAQHLMELFLERDMRSDGHRLLMLSWTRPTFATGYSSLRLEKTLDSVRIVVGEQLSSPVNDSTLALLAEDTVLGLAELAHIARSEGALVGSDLPRYRRFTARLIASKLEPQEFALLEEIAVATALATPWPMSPDRVRPAMHLSEKELIRITPNGLSCRNDALARSIAIYSAQEARVSFVDLLLSNFCRILAQPVLLRKAFVERIRETSIDNIQVWAGRPTDGGATSRSLLDELWTKHPRVVAELIMSSDTAVQVSIQLLHCPGQAAAAATFSRFWLANQSRVKNAIETDVTALAVIAAMAGQPEFADHDLKSAALSASRSESIRGAFRAMPFPEQTALLKSLSKLEAGSSRQLFTAAYDFNRLRIHSAGWSSRQLRRFFDRFTGAGLNMRSEFLANLSPEKLRALLVEEPRRFAYLRSKSPKNTLLSAARNALSTMESSAVDVTRWKQPRDLVRWVSLVNDLGRPDLTNFKDLEAELDRFFERAKPDQFIDLVEGVLPYRRSPIAKAIMRRLLLLEPSSHIVRSITLLNAAAGRKVLVNHGREALDRAIRSQNEWSLFWLLWSIAVYNPEDAVRAATQVEPCVTPPSPPNLLNLIIGGLTAHLAQQRSNDWELREPGSRERAPESWELLACVLSANARLAVPNASRSAWVRLMIEMLVSPTPKIIYSWQKLPTADRATIIRISSSSLQIIAQSPGGSKLVNAQVLETVSNSRFEWLWGAEMFSRVSLLAHLGQHEQIATLLGEATIRKNVSRKPWLPRALRLLLASLAAAGDSPLVRETIIREIETIARESKSDDYRSALANLRRHMTGVKPIIRQATIVNDDCCRALNGDQVALARLSTVLGAEELAILAAFTERQRA
jgi:hypothetical protein